MFSKKDLQKNAILLLLIVSLLSIIAAFILERFFNFVPCYLCRAQQFVYVFLFVVSLFYLLLSKYRGAIYFFSLLLLVVNLSLSGYQAGVQRGIIDPYFKCSKSFVNLDEKEREKGANDIDLRDRLKSYKKQISQVAPHKDCYISDDKIFGFTLAQYNFILSLLMIVTFIFAYLFRRLGGNHG